MISEKRVIQGIFILILFVICSSATPSIALEVATHRAINEYIADKNTILQSFSLQQYLQNQLSLQNGSEEYVNGKKVFKWIGDGGVNEDDYVRPRNHFYDPITNKGLSVKGKSVGESASEWATLPIGVQDFSWNDVRAYYRNALTAPEKETRETNFAKTFRGLGQIMHLVQDMSIPAHTRNDDHVYIPLIPYVAKGDPYEKWAENNIDQRTPFGTKYTAYAYEPYNKDSFLIPQLFDSGQYPDVDNKLDPNITVSQKNIGLAEYTNANFLSNGTIFKDFGYPSYKPGISMAENPATIGGKRVLYLKKIGEGETINHFARAGRFLEKLPAEYKELNLTIKDDNIHQDYANLLISRAIGYSSQVLKYFFRGQLDVTLGDGNIIIKNASDDTISNGKFRLYYDKKGVRAPLTDLVDAYTLKKGSGEQTIAFNKPEGVESYMLVYEGQLGAEPNAVIGKFIPVDNTFAVFTISAPGKKSTEVVYDIRNKSILLTARESTDAEYVSWLAKTKADSNSSPMFYDGDVLFSDTAPYKFHPEFEDTFNGIICHGGYWHYYHANDNRAEGFNYYRAWYFPQSRALRVRNITPTYYTGFRTEINNIPISCTDIAHMHCTDRDVQDDIKYDFTFEGGMPEYIDGVFWEYALVNMLKAIYPPPDYIFHSHSWVENVTNLRKDIKFYSQYGQVGETKSVGGVIISDSVNSGLYVGTDYTDIPLGNYHIWGEQSDDCFAMATVIVIKPVHTYFEAVAVPPLIPGEPPIEGYALRSDPQPKEIYVQAAGEYFNGKEFYEKSPNPILEAELKKGIELFYTVNGFANNEFCKEMSFGITMRKSIIMQ